MSTKVEQIQAEIDNKNAAIEQEAANGQQTNHEQIIQWRNEISVLQMQLSDARAEEELQQHTQVQQQAQAAQIGGLKEIIRSIRDAVYLKELMDRALGLTENEKNMQDFNSMVDQAVDEDQTALYAAFNTQLEQRDEKYRTLTLQALEVQRQLEKSNEEANHFSALSTQHEQALEKLTEINSKMEKEISDHDEQLRQRDEEIQRMKQHEFDLQQQLANIQTKPQIIDITPTTASESLSERIAQAKENSKLQLANVKAIGANWVEGINAEGNKEIAHVSAVEHVTEFPSIPAIPAITEQVEQFPEENTNHDVHSGGAQATEGNQTVHELVQPAAEETTVTVESLKAEIDALKSAHDLTIKKVDRLEKQANLPIAV